MQWAVPQSHSLNGKVGSQIQQCNESGAHVEKMWSNKNKSRMFFFTGMSMIFYIF